MEKGPRKQLSSEERGQIVGAYRCGVRPTTITRTLGFPSPTVYGIVNHYKKTGSAQPKARLGRPQILNDRDQRVVKRVALAGRRRSLGEITNEVNTRLGMNLCQATVRRYMAKDGFSSRDASKKPLLSEKTSKPDKSGVKRA